jgi:hypothetical protein
MKIKRIFLLAFLLLFTVFSGKAQREGDEIIEIEPLRNPDRGFHLESNYFAHTMTNPFRKDELFPKGFIEEREKAFEAQNEALTLLQLYVYLSEWVDKDISPEGLENIQTLFDNLKRKGYKAILRFAYNWKGLNTSGGESEKQILRHIEQLTPLLEKNRGLITTMQIGFLGAWGEWHTTPLQDDADAKNAVVNALLKAYPHPYSLQIRVPDHKNKLKIKEEDKVRIGYANDYFTAGEHSHAPGNDFVPGSKWYKQVENESPFFFMSGEIPYDENTEWGLAALISPETTLKILRDHHYSAFDITQNYQLNIRSWKNLKVYPEFLKKNNILFSDDYFLNEEGKAVARSFFEFVRDHLGYRLNMLGSSIRSAGKNMEYNFRFSNTGFASVINPKPVYLVFIDSRNKVVKEIRIEANPRDWQPYDPRLKTYRPVIYQLKGIVPVHLKGKYEVGIWMPDSDESLRYNPLYDVKWVPNKNLRHRIDEEGRYAINIMGEIVF